MKNRGFTLIELLVVISIIGLLSSVILASLATARTRGILAAAEVQSTSVFHTLGDSSVLQLDFDECSGTIAHDQSASQVNGTLSALTMWTSDTYNGRGCALTFNGTNQYVSVPASSGLELGGGSSFTLSAWVKTNTNGNDSIIIEHSIWGANDVYQLDAVGPTSIRFNFPALNSREGPLDATVNYTDGNWHYVAATLDASRQLASIYFDGKLINSKTVVETPTPSASPAATYIGARGGTRNWYAGSLDEIRIYTRVITAREIRAIYIAEAPFHGVRVAENIE